MTKATDQFSNQLPNKLPNKLPNAPPKLSQLVALVAIAEQGSFSAAALHLGLAQSTISHAIATLESDLGVVLLLRNHAGAVLTPLGSQIYQQARGVLDQLQTIRQTADQAKGLQTGRVRVAAVRTVATHILPGVIFQFRQIHPQLTVEIFEYDRYVDVERSLREGETEVGFTLLPASSDFQSWELFREAFVALLPPADSPTNSPADSPADSQSNSQSDSQSSDSQSSDSASEALTWEQLVSYSRIVNTRSTQHNNLVTKHLARFGYHSPIEYEVREDSTLMSLVKKGLGAAVLARLEAEPVPAGVRVKPLPEPLERVVGVAILANAVLPRAVFVFLDVLLALDGSITPP